MDIDYPDDGPVHDDGSHEELDEIPGLKVKQKAKRYENSVRSLFL
jgi:hypothetical protein